MRRRGVSLILTFCMIFCYSSGLGATAVYAATTPAFSGGSGTQNDPYLIASADDLVSLQTYVNTGGGSEVYAYYKQTADIDLSGVSSWTPIGTKASGSTLSTCFSGVYNGDSHSITNMKIVNIGGEGVGLFGHIANAEIKNLRVDGTISYIKQSGNSALMDIGGIAGGTVHLTDETSEDESVCAISGCTSNVNITTQALAGGICGNTETNTTFTNCDFTGSITATLTSSYPYESYGLGGICGTSQGNDTFSGCLNAGSITTLDGDANVGGIVGWTSNTAGVTIDSCYNAGTLKTAEASSATGVGGIVGKRTNGYSDDNENQMSISNSYNTGTLTSGETGTMGTGGIVGRVVVSSVGGNEIWTDETLNNVYSLAGSATYVVRGVSTSGERQEGASNITNAKTFSALSELSGKLGDKFTSAMLLYWQDADTTYNVTFKYMDASTGDALSDVTLQVDGQAAAAAYKAGTHTYTATKTGYDSKSGSFAVSRGDMTVTIALAQAKSETTDPGSGGEDNPSGGEYTEPQKDADGTYLVGTASELAWIDQQATSVSVTRAADFKDFDVRLTADIDMSGYEWIPVSGRDDDSSKYIYASDRTYYSGGSYCGTFDGDGHTISNLTIDITNKYDYGARFDAVGLFGYVKDGTIKDLGITGNITVKDNGYSTYGDWMMAGGIAGYVSSASVISGCYTDADITVGVERTSGGTVKHDVPIDTYAGGIAGAISRGVTVSDCYTKGSVSADTTRFYGVGGIVGQARRNKLTSSEDGDDTEVPNYIKRCWSSSALSAKSDYRGADAEEADYGFVGGIVGEVDGLSDGSIPNISYCFALNPSISGDSPENTALSAAGRVVGNGDRFGSNGEYNYALDTMNISNIKVAEGDPDASGYRTAAGKDVTAEKAVKESTYTNVTWNYGDAAGIWKFDGKNYPVFVWQTSSAETAGDEILSVIPVSYDSSAPSNNIEYTAPEGGWKTGQANTFTLRCESAACVVVLKKSNESIQRVKPNAGGTAQTGCSYSVTPATGDTVNVYIAGDVNLDGELNVADAMIIANTAVYGTADMTDAIRMVADVTGDDAIDILDVLDVLAAGLGKLSLTWR